MPASAGALDDKVYQVCKKWRVDQGGWMATDQMQHCRTVLFCASMHREGSPILTKCYDGTGGGTQPGAGGVGNFSEYVTGEARNVAKACLQDGNC